jgi:predicted Na+-dependent transporter
MDFIISALLSPQLIIIVVIVVIIISISFQFRPSFVNNFGLYLSLSFWIIFFPLHLSFRSPSSFVATAADVRRKKKVFLIEIIHHQE